MLAIEKFWTAISASHPAPNAGWEEYNVNQHLENLAQHMQNWSKDDLIDFEKYMQDTLHRLYTAQIVDLYKILENPFSRDSGSYKFDDYVSTDGFIYFRCWMTLQGRDFIEDMLNDIEIFSSGKYSFNIGDIWAEGLLYVADDAWSIHHENEEKSEIRDSVEEKYPDTVHYDDIAETMDNEPCAGDGLQGKYPFLVKEICALRS